MSYKNLYFYYYHSMNIKKFIELYKNRGCMLLNFYIITKFAGVNLEL